MRRIVLSVLLAATVAVPAQQALASGRTVHCAGAVSIVSCATTNATIQGAVDASSSGDAVVIASGVYNEAVKVTTPNLIIRGEDRNGVVVDGTGLEDNADGIEITTDHVEVSNLTVRDFAANGVHWNGPAASDYVGDHLTAYDIGTGAADTGYGIFSFAADRGRFVDSYASGNKDSGFYIGGCHPCHALIDNVTAEYNGLGYSGTNAGGDLVIRNSHWNYNGGGILPNSLDSEPNGPQEDAIITGNIVVGSGAKVVPSTNLTAAANGIGIGVSGGNRNDIVANDVSGSSRYGIAIFPFPETTPNLYMAADNHVTNNTVTGSTMADLALAGGSGARNCFAGNNAAATSDPPLIETIYSCGYGNPILSVPASGSATVGAELVAYYLPYALGVSSGPSCGDAGVDPVACADPRGDNTPTMADPLAGI